MKRTKTDWRSKLSAESLTDLITVSLYSPDISSYNPTEAVDLWWEGSTLRRRPEQNSYQRIQTESDTDDRVDSQECEDRLISFSSEYSDN